eukprot:4565222-Pleurochrysis_carterae.AAC.3
MPKSGKPSFGREHMECATPKHCSLHTGSGTALIGHWSLPTATPKPRESLEKGWKQGGGASMRRGLSASKN